MLTTILTSIIFVFLLYIRCLFKYALDLRKVIRKQEKEIQCYKKWVKVLEDETLEKINLS